MKTRVLLYIMRSSNPLNPISKGVWLLATPLKHSPYERWAAHLLPSAMSQRLLRMVQ